ncbi:HNH endonuclease-domain-containing protein [Lipomyces tetrasporus]|uniref:HNH endonuclease-domain-containing protein n=1 Tax=Lipomyces tetrasporus TaxID=54092 RepID=A0AAD7VVV9_9ASCO|nr:HNH endonuclease-domain-containing protein [Lipomyces tetrasporus]KAJ8103466.1 HNH endonuclease-domain-containing protein [Lipomyces tetrasporus]
MATSRAIGRNVHFYVFSEPDEPLGGLRLNPSVTAKNFLYMLDILIVASGPYRVILRSAGVDLRPTDDALTPGDYDIRPYSRRTTIAITEEPCITRILSRSLTGRDDFFRARVRERDGKCVITGTVNGNAPLNIWRGFEAAHIFPLSSEEHWLQKGYLQWISNRKGDRDTGINSCQNGLLMRSDVHQGFDGFDFSINPDDGYKITCFDNNPSGIDGRMLDTICRESRGEEGARDELLRWHFRQAVLANMRGSGEPSFEMDFPPGSDMMGEILSGPEPGNRMEAELFSRLNGVLDSGAKSHIVT